MKKIACIAHGPGTANALFPIIEQLKNKQEIELFLYSFHSYVSQLWNVETTQEEHYLKIFEKEYDLIIYGTGSGHVLEKNVSTYAKEKKIKTLSIIDIFWMDDKNLTERFPVFPDYIVVPTNEVKERLINLKGIDENSLFVFGNPHFDRLEKYKQSKTIGKPPYHAVFFSQPTTNGNYSDTHPDVKEALKELMQLKNENDLFETLVVTPHPREDTKWLEHFCKEYEHLFLEKEKDSFSLLLQKDINIGINCTLQYESQIIGKPTIFYRNKAQAKKTFEQIQHTVIIEPYKEFHATEKTIALIQKILY